MIIGITGKIGSGKSRISKFLEEEYSFEEYAFATPLKKIGEIFGFSKEQLYGTQEQKLEVHSYWNVSAREFLQKVGTDLFRKNFSNVLPSMNIRENIWSEVFRYKYHENPKNYVISDVRFLDEANIIRQLGGIVIRTVRDRQNDGIEHSHSSETEMDKIVPDFTVDNNGEFNETIIQLENILEHFINKEDVNHLEKLLKLFPDKPWNWNGLCGNPNMTWKFIQKINKPYIDWFRLSQNPNITEEILRDNPDKPWKWSLSLNPSITWEFMRDNPDYPWNWEFASMNPNITWEIVRENLESEDPKPWKWPYLSQNPNITWEIIRENPDYPWDWRGLSMNPNITWETVEKYPEINWDWDVISFYPNLTWKFVQENPDKNWNWCGLSVQCNITWEIIRDNPNLPWIWNWVSRNPNITWEIIRDNPDRPWDWEFVSQNPNITWEIVRDNPGYPWDWEGLTDNFNITWEIVRDNPDHPWDLHGLSKNPSITWEIIRDNPGQSWDWYSLSENRFTKHPDMIQKRKEKDLENTDKVFEHFSKTHSNVEKGIKDILKSFIV